MPRASTAALGMAWALVAALTADAYEPERATFAVRAHPDRADAQRSPRRLPDRRLSVAAVCRGHAADSFVIMSGFRTPFYNESIGNVRYSRHQWGGAADIYIDESPRDGRMDDLDGNGHIDIEDARGYRARWGG